MKKSHNQGIIIFLAFCILLTACEPVVTTTPTSILVPTDTALPGPSTGWLQVYFTSPGLPNASNYEGGPDEALAAAIDAAILSVDVAIYNLNLWSIRDALIYAQQRGVTVRMVMESDNMMDEEEVQDLLSAGIPIRADRHEGLMHNKFVVIDRFEVWTGSMNYTVGGAYKDNNNMLRIRSVQVAEDYTNEFEEMFIEDHFGPDDIANTPHPRLSIDGTPVEVYFSPDDGAEMRILELIQAAQESVHFMVYSFTSDEIGNAVVFAAQMNLIVSGVVDEEQASTNQGTEYDLFRQNGMNVRLDGNNGLMHHKVMIIDEEIVITGSYNFSDSAERRNDENVVIIFSPEVAGEFMAEFQRVYGMAKP